MTQLGLITIKFNQTLNKELLSGAPPSELLDSRVFGISMLPFDPYQPGFNMSKLSFAWETVELNADQGIVKI